jgi:Flp pilus assembly protein TadD
MAAESAKLLQARMQNVDTAEGRAALLTLRGVSATNRNDWSAAKQDFLKAYSLDPNSAFSLNNLGYVSERDGDLETAQFFYAKAEKADDAEARIGLATQSSAAGKHLVAVATDSDLKVDDVLDQNKQARRQQAAPIQLNRRVKTPEGDSRVSPEEPSPSPSAPSTSMLQTPHSN